MKTRTGFVSNSSSSSFIVLYDESIIPKGVIYVELNETQKEILVDQKYIDKTDQKVFLTQFVSDGADEYYEFYESSTDEFEWSGKLIDNVVEYHDGGHGWPYQEDCYDEIADRVWLWKGYWDED